MMELSLAFVVIAVSYTLTVWAAPFPADHESGSSSSSNRPTRNRHRGERRGNYRDGATESEYTHGSTDPFGSIHTHQDHGHGQFPAPRDFTSLTAEYEYAPSPRVHRPRRVNPATSEERRGDAQHMANIARFSGMNLGGASSLNPGHRSTRTRSRFQPDHFVVSDLVAHGNQDPFGNQVPNTFGAFGTDHHFNYGVSDLVAYGSHNAFGPTPPVNYGVSDLVTYDVHSGGNEASPSQAAGEEEEESSNVHVSWASLTPRQQRRIKDALSTEITVTPEVIQHIDQRLTTTLVDQLTSRHRRLISSAIETLGLATNRATSSGQDQTVYPEWQQLSSIDQATIAGALQSPSMGGNSVFESVQLARRLSGAQLHSILTQINDMNRMEEGSGQGAADTSEGDAQDQVRVLWEDLNPQQQIEILTALDTQMRVTPQVIHETNQGLTRALFDQLTSGHREQIASAIETLGLASGIAPTTGPGQTGQPRWRLLSNSDRSSFRSHNMNSARNMNPVLEWGDDVVEVTDQQRAEYAHRQEEEHRKLRENQRRAAMKKAEEEKQERLEAAEEERIDAEERSLEPLVWNDIPDDEKNRMMRAIMPRLRKREIAIDYFSQMASQSMTQTTKDQVMNRDSAIFEMGLNTMKERYTRYFDVWKRGLNEAQITRIAGNIARTTRIDISAAYMIWKQKRPKKAQLMTMLESKSRRELEQTIGQFAPELIQGLERLRRLTSPLQ